MTYKTAIDVQMDDKSSSKFDLILSSMPVKKRRKEA
jgi:hypothetical protein